MTRRIRNHIYASPNKVFEAMIMCGKPIIVSDGHINGQYSKNRKISGLVVPYGDVNAIQNRNYQA